MVLPAAEIISLPMVGVGNDIDPVPRHVGIYLIQVEFSVERRQENMKAAVRCLL